MLYTQMFSIAKLCARGHGVKETHTDISNVPQYKESDAWSICAVATLVYLFEGRLGFGGRVTAAQTIWGSSSNNFLTSSQPKQMDDDSVEVTMDNDRASAIEQLCSG